MTEKPAGASLLRPGVVAALLLGSGFCALVYQVAWLRSLRLVFGASTASNAAVLAIFMGGLGAGALWFGPRADKHRNPLLLYSLLEFAIAALAAVSPYLVQAARSVYIAAGGTLALGPFVGTGLKLVLAVLVLGGPTFLMGGTLPAAVRAVQSDHDRHRRSLALLYGANTMGAVTGALLATFLFLEVLGVQMSLLVAALLNVVVAVIARGLSRRSETVSETAPGSDTPTPPSHGTGVSQRAVLIAAAVVGFAFLLMELVWYRMLAPILGGSSYTFGLILAFALLGIGIGGLLYARRDPGRPVTRALFVGTCLAEAFFFALPYAFGDELAVLTLFLRPLEGLGFLGLAGGWSLVVMIVVLPGATVAGYQFPVLVALMGQGRDGVGRQVGLAYSWNTLGAITGSLAGGFGLLPMLTAPGAWRLVIGLLLLLAVVFATWGGLRRGGWRAYGRPGLLLLLTLGLVWQAGPSAVWRHTAIGAGRAPRQFADPNERLAWENRARASVVWEREGVESSVALVRKNGYAFMINGKIDGNARGDAPTQIMLGMLGAMLHPNPRLGLVIGLGSGASAGWLGTVPSMERVDVVELEPAIVDVARDCSPVNEAVLDNDRVRVLIGDAREVLPTAPDRYDLIMSEPSNPYRAGIASLFTREFYEAVDGRLTENGMFLQWVQDYEVDARTIRTIYATLGAVFPSVETWVTKSGSDLILVATRSELEHDVTAIAERLRQEPFRSALLRGWGVDGVEGLFTGFVARASLGRLLAEHADAEVCTDDNGLVEFGFARSVGRKGLFDMGSLQQLAVQRGEASPNVKGVLDLERVAELRVARMVAEDRFSAALTIPPGPMGQRHQARQSYAQGDLTAALQHWRAQQGQPDNLTDQTLVAEAMAEAGLDEAERWIEAVSADQPVAAAVIRARWFAARGESARAQAMLLQGLVAYRSDPWPLSGLMRRALELGQDLALQNPTFARALFDALEPPFSLELLTQERLMLRARLGFGLDFNNLCVSALAPLEPHVPWEYDLLEARVRCYEWNENALLPRAQAEWERFQANQPPALL